MYSYRVATISGWGSYGAQRSAKYEEDHKWVGLALSTVQSPKRGGVHSKVTNTAQYKIQITMSKAKKLSLGGGTEAPKKSEYDDEEADFVTGKKIAVKSDVVNRGGGAGDGSKAYNFTGITPGSECKYSCMT